MVRGVDEFVEGAAEDETAFVKHHEGCGGVGLSLGEWNHAALLGVVAVGAECEGVLKAMGDEKWRVCGGRRAA